jgi:hypothetical protein
LGLTQYADEPQGDELVKHGFDSALGSAADEAHGDGQGALAGLDRLKPSTRGVGDKQKEG